MEIQVKYDGYVSRQESEISKLQKLERKKLPLDVDFEKIRGLSNEAKERLSIVRPVTIGQASRVAGVTPADVSVLIIWLDARSRTTPLSG